MSPSAEVPVATAGVARGPAGDALLEVPPLAEIEPGHEVACFNPVPVDEWDRARVSATA